jgi:hypothetical protein
MPGRSLSLSRADVYSVILSLSALIKAAAAQIGKAPAGRHYPVYIDADPDEIRAFQLFTLRDQRKKGTGTRRLLR